MRCACGAYGALPVHQLAQSSRKNHGWQFDFYDEEGRTRKDANNHTHHHLMKPLLTKRLLSSSSSSAAAAQRKVSSVLRYYDTNVNDVPRIPIPSVSATMTRYLETISPLVSKEDLERNKKLVHDFVSSPSAEKLQNHLLKVRDGEGYPYHYFEEAWDDMCELLLLLTIQAVGETHLKIKPRYDDRLRRTMAVDGSRQPLLLARRRGQTARSRPIEASGEIRDLDGACW